VRLRRDGWEDVITNKIGMWRIFAALSAVSEEVPNQSVTFADSYDQVDWDFQAYNKEPTRRQIPHCSQWIYGSHVLVDAFPVHKASQLHTDMKALLRQYFPVVARHESRRHGMFDSVEERQTNLSNLFQGRDGESRSRTRLRSSLLLAITIPAIRTKNTRLRTTS
jgi:hypothetical protein